MSTCINPHIEKPHFTDVPVGCAIHSYILTTEEGPGYNICNGVSPQELDTDDFLRLVLTESISEFKASVKYLRIYDAIINSQIDHLTGHIIMRVRILYKLPIE